MLHAWLVPDPRNSDARREPRIDIDADVPMRALGEQPVRARLINISSNGFMAQADGSFPAGSRVWLTLPGFPRVNALVIWSQGARLGGEFSEPIDPLRVFEALGKDMFR